jgi:2-haloalkanoic acid dehalogenase type II
VAVVAFDSLGTLFDLGDLEERMPSVLLHAVSLSVVGRWVPLDELAAALDPELADRLPGLEPYDDALPALERVAAAGDEAWILTNGGRASTEELLERAGLAGLVAEIRSAEEVERYKPHPEVYELLPNDSTLVASHVWDVAGAMHAGRRGVWVARHERAWPLPDEPAPDETVPDLVAAARSAGGA